MPATTTRRSETSQDRRSSMDDVKRGDVQIENPAHHALEPDQMKSDLDALSISRTLVVFWKTSLVCSLVAFSALCDGYQVNLNGSIVANTGFINQFGTVVSSTGIVSLDAQWVSAWGGIQSVGQVIAFLTLTWASDVLGRKRSLYAIWIIMVASVLCESLCKAPWSWFIAKLLAGIGVGGMQATIPVYITEISQSRTRGILVNAYSTWFVFGQFLAPLVLQQLNAHDPTNFRTPILTQWAFIGALIVFWTIVPESPWWLCQKNRPDRAAAVLRKLNGSIKGYDVDAEVAIINNVIEHERRQAAENAATSYWEVFRGTDGWRLLIACTPKCLQQLTGLTVVNSYSTYFFQLAGNKDPFLVTVILACVQMISIILVSIYTDVRRRPFVVWGFMACSLCLLAVGIIGCFNYASYSLGSLLIFVACVAIFTNTAAGALGYAYVAEIPTQRLRTKTTGFALAAASAFGVCFSFSVPIMLKGAPAWGIKTGFFFACTGIPASTLAWLILPETAGRSQAEIDEMFEKKVPPRKFRRYVTDVQINVDSARAEARV